MVRPCSAPPPESTGKGMASGHGPGQLPCAPRVLFAVDRSPRALHGRWHQRRSSQMIKISQIEVREGAKHPNNQFSRCQQKLAEVIKVLQERQEQLAKTGAVQSRDWGD